MPSNWFCSVVLSKAGEQECYKGFKTYILWWFRRHRTEVPLTLLHWNLNYVMECGVFNFFCTIERAIEVDCARLTFEGRACQTRTGLGPKLCVLAHSYGDLCY
jgi:hypothetical protein